MPKQQPKPEPLPLSEALRVGVRTSGRSQRQIALAAKVAPPALSRFLNGHREIELTTASELARVLGLELVRVAPRR